MKIPTYQNKVRMSDAIASQPLNVQANSGAFEGAGQALVTVGNAIAAQSAWLDTEQKLVNATEVAKAKTAYEAELIKLEDEISKNTVYNSKPKQAQVYFNLRAKQLSLRAAGSITGRKARTTFASEAQALNSTTGLRITKLARTRLVSENITKALEDADTQERKLSKLDPNSKEYKDIYASLYGVKDDKGRILVSGIFDKLEEIGYLSAKDRFTYEKRSKGNVNRNSINQLLLGASELSGSKDDIESGAAGKQAMQVYNDLKNPNLFKDLSVNDRQNFSEQALSLATQLDERRVRLFNTKESNEKKARTKKQLNNFNALSSRFLTAKTNPNDGDAQQKQPTLIEIEKMFINKQISESQKNSAIKMLNQQGSIITDQAFLANLIEKIRKADSKAEIEKVIDEGYKNVTTRLNFENMTSLRQMAEQYNSKTPRMKRAKIFGNLVDDLIKPTGILDKILPGSSQRAAQIKTKFEIAILEGVEPIDAFNEAVKSFDAQNKVNLKAIPPPKFLPNYPIRDALTLEQPNRDISTWTMADVATSREMTKTKFKGGIGSLALELFNLDLIERYIEQRDAVNSDVSKVLDEQTKELNELNK